MKPSQLRKRTDNIEGKIDQWHMRYEKAHGLEYAGELLSEAIGHMELLQKKVNSQAEIIKQLQGKNLKIVHCLDCIYWDTEAKVPSCYVEGLHLCRGMTDGEDYTFPDDFCSMGERNEHGQE